MSLKESDETRRIIELEAEAEGYMIRADDAEREVFDLQQELAENEIEILELKAELATYHAMGLSVKS